MVDAPELGIGLADAIEMLRAELLEARTRAAGSKIQFPVASMTVELKVAATRSAGGKAGFAIPVVNVQLGGTMGWQRDAMQTVTVTFGSPVDDHGKPLQVVAVSDELKA